MTVQSSAQTAEARPDLERTPPSSSWGIQFVEDRPAQSAALDVKLHWRILIFEWAILLGAILIYCAPLLNPSPQRLLPGNESTVFQAQDIVLWNSLRLYGQFPLWNPYLFFGIPFLGDPFTHVLNPFASIPVLLLGPSFGYKVATCLGILIAGLGMWWLGAALHLNPVVRVWIGLMYAFTGQAAAKFVQGHYDFVMAYGWMAAALAFTLLAVRTRRVVYAFGAAFSLALVFLSGNVYYAFYMALVMVVLALVTTFGFSVRQASLVIHRDCLVMLALIGVLSLGLMAVQLLPTMEFTPWYTKAKDEAMTGSHTLYQIWLDYTSPDMTRQDAMRFLPPEEFYAYLGLAPFLCLPLLLFVRRRHWRVIVACAAILMVMVVWIDIRDMPFSAIYRTTNALNQFRYPSRMLIVGAMILDALGGMGMNALWERLTQRRSGRGTALDNLAGLASLLVLTGLLLFMVGSAYDVYQKNRRPLNLVTRVEPNQALAEWLATYDPSPYYIRAEGQWHEALTLRGIRNMYAWYGFTFFRRVQETVIRREFMGRPKYIIARDNQKPDEPDPVLIYEAAPNKVFYMPHSLPYSFLARNEELYNKPGARELRAEDVTALNPVTLGPNTVEVTADSPPNHTLVLLTSLYPGWTVTIDGQPAPLVNVNGYLGVNPRPGPHLYRFHFAPLSVYVGLGVTGLTLLAMLSWVGVQLVTRGRRRRHPAPAVALAPAANPAGPALLPVLPPPPSMEARGSPVEPTLAEDGVTPDPVPDAPAELPPMEVRQTVDLAPIQRQVGELMVKVRQLEGDLQRLTETLDTLNRSAAAGTDRPEGAAEATGVSPEE